MIAVDQIVRVPLLPVLAAQGLLVRRKAQLLPEPVGARHGQSGSGPKLRLLIAGDSSAAGVGAQTQDTALSGQLVTHLAPHFSVDWRVEATTGHITPDTIARLKDLPKQRFDVVVFALGVNDVTRATTSGQFYQRQAKLMTLLRDRFTPRLILTSGVLKMELFPALPQPLAWVLGQQAARLDRAQARLAETVPELHRLPLDIPVEPRFAATDGYHPSPAFYQLWARSLGNQIIAHHT